MFASVVGEEVIKSSIIYDNVRQISEQLMILSMESGEDLVITRRYYGMYTVLLKILMHMQQQFINNIDEVYQPRIVEIQNNVQDVNRSTRDLMRQNNNSQHQQHLQANLRAQQLTLKAATLYQQHLQNQRAKMAAGIAKNSTRLCCCQQYLPNCDSEQRIYRLTAYQPAGF